MKTQASLINFHFSLSAFLLAWLCFLSLPAALYAQGDPAFVGFSGTSCDDLSLSAETMVCDTDGCLLEVGVSLRCPGMHLWADKLFLELDAEGMFKGAYASGNVTLVEGKNVLQCTQIDLGPDRIKGNIHDADIRVESKPVSLAARPTKKGRTEAFVSGQIERKSEKSLTLRDGTFTLCDCEDGEPSWTVHSPKIDVTLNERATVYWPTMWAHVLGLFQMPILPPLAPISVPLKKRSSGFLTPEISFLRMPHPMVDLPFFVPLGDSYDRTLKPGMRFDWGSHKADDFLSWGAPRLGTRFRYHPKESIKGEFNVQWTYDPYHWSAKWIESDAYQRALDNGTADDLSPPPPWKKTSPQWDLTHRVLVDLEQKIEFSPELDWSTAIHWMSDDRILSDFALTLEERATTFQPSRTQLHWRPPGKSLRIAADHFLLLNNDSQDYSNVWGAEAETLHAGPMLELRFMPTKLWSRLYWDGELGFSRYGTWLADKKAALYPLRYGPWYPGSQAALYITYGRAGLGWKSRIAGFDTSFSAHTDTLVSQIGFEPQVSTFAQVDANIKTTLYRTYGDFVHTLTPLLLYRLMPDVRGDIVDLPGVDERLDRRELNQIVLGLSQELWARGPKSKRKRKFVFDIRQPYSLQESRALQTDLRFGFDAFGMIALNAFGSLDLKDQKEPWRERTVSGRIVLGPLRFGGLYTHWHPEAERFERSLYELAAVPAPSGETTLEESQWIHSLQASTSLSLFRRLTLSYGATYLLPLNDAEFSEQEEDDYGFLVHRASLAYRSACRCWGLSVNASLPAETMFDGMRLTFLFSIGDYTIGKKH